MNISWIQYTLTFKRPSGTSRGILVEKDSYFLVSDDGGGKKAIGECGLLKGLSWDDRPGYEKKLEEVCEELKEGKNWRELYGELIAWPSIQGGLEMVFQDFSAEQPFILYPSAFTDGTDLQKINGLIWMGDVDFMREQVKDRLEKGFDCIKMKIGAIDFEEELNILKAIRKDYGVQDIELRVDANGAFHPDEALEKLKRLSAYELHSIEQPIKPRQWEEMARLCEQSPIPIALDEELIGIASEDLKQKALKQINPQYIILKPSLIGGFMGSESWIQLAEDMNIGWWVTSALESNIGLNAIAQWAYTLGNSMPQGLGTGSLYTNNFPSPLYIQSGQIGYEPDSTWDVQLLEN